MSRRLLASILLLAITVLAGGGIFALYRSVLAEQLDGVVQVIASSGQNGSLNPDGDSPSAGGASGDSSGGSSGNSSSGASGGGSSGPSGQPSAEAPQDDISRLMAQADRIAVGYDYNKAVELINSGGLDLENSRMKEALTRYKLQKAALVPADMNAVIHIFSHSLTMDTSKAFDEDSDNANCNSVVTTKDEFLKILEDMHQKGRALVRIHDIACKAPDENGNIHSVKDSIMLLKGKKPFVMSQNDVCYYPYIGGDGFAERVVIREDGKPTCETAMDDGTISTGSYGLIPFLGDFIQEHPGFPYKGVRVTITFTDYEGILGHRTVSPYQDGPAYEADREQAARVAQCLKDNGWELASHSWGHLHLGVVDGPQAGFATDEERFQADTGKWEAEVEPLIGPTNITPRPYGDDIVDRRLYHQDNPRFAYLEFKGFRYSYNVDASKSYWTQTGTNHFRIARRSLDDYRLYEDPIQTDPARKRLTDLFDAIQVFDSARLTLVSWSYQK